MEEIGSKPAALAALRTWQTYVDDRDRLVLNARRAGATLAEIGESSGLAKNTIRSILEAHSEQEAPMPVDVDPLTGFHHPHFVSVDTTNQYRYQWYFRPFTGHEDQPKFDYDVVLESRRSGGINLNADQELLLEREYRAAADMWALARFRRDARAKLSAAAPVWEVYASAREEVQALFDGLDGASDTGWKASILRLSKAHSRLRAAAEAWDTCAHGLTKLEQAHNREVSEDGMTTLAAVAPELGFNITTWDMTELDDYKDAARGYEYAVGRTVAGKTDKLIDEQRGYLKEVAELTGSNEQ